MMLNKKTIGSDKLNQSAITIQKHWRAYRVRLSFKKLLKRQKKKMFTAQ